MTERASCWSITINNPKDEEYQIVLPAKWKLQGQLEKGAEGTIHYQGMLTTSQVRFSAVKKVFPRAHIEVARNKTALQKYVQKEETRVATVQSIPTLFEYQTIIAEKWVDEEFRAIGNRRIEANIFTDWDDVAMLYLDRLVSEDIESGRRGAEFIAINPMWRSSWKKFWSSIIKRHAQNSEARTREEASVSSPAEQESAEQEDGGSGVCISETDASVE